MTVSAAVLAVSFGLASCASAHGGAKTSPRSYVALGDSYTSGPLIAPAATPAPAQCNQSARNYPHLTADQLSLALTDVSCGGATVADLSTAQYPGRQPAQLDALKPDTAVVSVGIGGNDNNTFGSMTAGCVGAERQAAPGTDAPCEAAYGTRCADAVAADETNISAALRQIHQRSPKAKVFVVGYPSILPENGSCGQDVPLSAGDRRYVVGIERDLNAMLKHAAESNSAVYVDTYTPSLGHDACQDTATRWVEPLIVPSGVRPLHPNATGQARTAVALTAAMRTAGL